MAIVPLCGIVSYCPSKGAARFVCAQAGCRACVESLLREHNGLVWLMVSQQWSGKADYADLFQEGRIGLWQAILHFDPGRGVAFSSYACVVIRRQIWAAVRHSIKAEGWLEYERAGDSLEALLAAWQQEQIQQALGEALALLPEQLRQVIQLHYGMGGEAPHNLAEIGRAWGKSREWIRRLHNQALGLLRLPALSIRLWSICERAERANYRQALRQNQDWQHKRRRQR
jgi:RNA polymerase sigma factor (sigma-70 family)